MGESRNGSDLILSGLKFNGTLMGEVCRNDKNTISAVLLIAFSVAAGAVIAYFNGNGGSSGLGGMGLSGTNAAIAQTGSLLIGTFLSALVMVFIIRIFKVKPSYSGIIRVYGAAIIWTIIKTAVGLFLPEGFAMAAILFWLAYNFALMFGLAGYTGIKIWQSFLSIVLTFAVIFGIMILYGIAVEAVFV